MTPSEALKKLKEESGYNKALRETLTKPIIKAIDDNSKLYRVYGYRLPLKYTTLKQKGIDEKQIIEVVDRQQYWKEYREEQERIKQEQKENNKKKYDFEKIW